jgi:hypothetical protein
MNTRILLITAIVSALVFGCSTDEDNPAKTGYTPGDVIGTWQAVIEAMPQFNIPDTLTVAMTLVEGQSACTLSVKKNSGLPLLIHNSTWAVLSDTLNLSATGGWMVDTAAEPDSLMPLTAEILATPIHIPINLTETKTWMILAGNLGPVIEAFPIAPETKAQIRTLVLELTKQ